MSVSDRYLDGQYQQAHSSWHEEDADFKAAHILEILRRSGRLSSIESICDVGCGTGGVLAQLAKSVSESVKLVGYEPSPQAIEIASTLRRQENVTLRKETSDAIPDGWDLILALDVFEHVEDYYGFLRSLRSKGRWYIFHIPLDMNVQFLVRRQKLLKIRKAMGHLHYFSWDTALATVTDCGYEIEQVKVTTSAIDRPKSTQMRIARPFRIAANRLSPKLASEILGGNSLLVLAH
jgi:cyclopropane fatty-acyl-phospholipid synthase-like methyltransferase